MKSTSQLRPPAITGQPLNISRVPFFRQARANPKTMETAFGSFQGDEVSQLAK
jgi:hypothetical protein